MTDEEYVKGKWEKAYQYQSLSGVPFIQFGSYALEAWSAAAEFTRQREEEIRQLRFDIAHVSKFRNAVGRYCTEHPYTTQTLEVEIPNLQSWTRILARLESALAEKLQGWKEQS